MPPPGMGGKLILIEKREAEGKPLAPLKLPRLKRHPGFPGRFCRKVCASARQQVAFPHLRTASILLFSVS